MDLSQYDLIIAGSGFYGLTIAERAAATLDARVLVLDKRAHFGGNSYSEVNSQTGIEVHKYGAHLFHTNSQEVWDYLHRFTSFTNYRHRVVAKHKNKFYTMPINLGTMSSFFGKFLSPQEARDIIADEIVKAGITTPRNMEEKAISLIGTSLYEAFIKSYTAKQWQTDPAQLPAEIITRLPVRFTFEDFYFADRFEGLPVNGYTAIFKKMLQAGKIDVQLNSDFFDIKAQIRPEQLVIYTGAIDRYFEYAKGTLGWRTIDFVQEILPIKDFQGAPVVNYPDADVDFTRIHEFRHFHPERQYSDKNTIIFREFSRFAKQGDEPYYPINTEKDKALYDAYKIEAEMQDGVIFGGRLGTHRYLDMHQAIGAALKVFEDEVAPMIKRIRGGHRFQRSF